MIQLDLRHIFPDGLGWFNHQLDDDLKSEFKM